MRLFAASTITYDDTELLNMKKGIHPEVHDVTARCTSCGFSFPTTSTSTELKGTLCSQCHPFFTGAQKFVDTAGRIDKFQQKYSKKK